LNYLADAAEVSLVVNPDDAALPAPRAVGFYQLVKVFKPMMMCEFLPNDTVRSIHPLLHFVGLAR
jgi:hypothetical protein